MNCAIDHASGVAADLSFIIASTAAGNFDARAIVGMFVLRDANEVTDFACVNPRVLRKTAIRFLLDPEQKVTRNIGGLVQEKN